jgi:hypothetical protein
MSNSYSGHSLVSNVTPWWWARHWDNRLPEIKQALGVITSLSAVEVESVSISRSGVSVTLAVADETDITKIQKEADELRWFLDEMVRPPSVVAAAAPLPPVN